MKGSGKFWIVISIIIIVLIFLMGGSVGKLLISAVAISSEGTAVIVRDEEYSLGYDSWEYSNWTDYSPTVIIIKFVNLTFNPFLDKIF